MQANVPPKDASLATGNVMFFQWFGGAILTCAAKTVFTSSIGPALVDAAPGIDASTIIYSGATELKNIVPPDEWYGVLLAYNKAIDNVFVSTILFFRVFQCLLTVTFGSVSSIGSGMLRISYWFWHWLEESEKGPSIVAPETSSCGAPV